MLSTCAATSAYLKDERFQSLKEAYKNKGYSDDHLAQALTAFRSRTGKDPDWFPVTAGERGAFTRYINGKMIADVLGRTDSKIDMDSVYNLYSNIYSLYNQEQLENVLDQITYHFSNYLNILQRTDRANHTRQELIELQGTDKKSGFEAIMDEILKIYKDDSDVDKRMARYDKARPNATPEQREQYRKKAESYSVNLKTLIANWDQIAPLAAVRIGYNEGFVVVLNNNKVSFRETTEDDLQNMSEGDAEGAGEENGTDNNEKSKGDRYIDYRTVKLMDSLSPKMKRWLVGIKKLDHNGKTIANDCGYSQYMEPRNVAVVLSRVLVNTEPLTMMDDLEVAADSYPWVQQVIDRLNNNPDDRALLYCAFKGVETTYYYTKFEYGTYSIHKANSMAAGRAMSRHAANNISDGHIPGDGTYAIVGPDGLISSLSEITEERKKLEKVLKVFSNISTIRDMPKAKLTSQEVKAAEKELADTFGINEDLSFLQDGGAIAIKTFFDRMPQLLHSVGELTRGIGVDITDEELLSALTHDMTRKFFFSRARGKRGWNTLGKPHNTNRLSLLLTYISDIHNQAWWEVGHLNRKMQTGRRIYNMEGSTYDAISDVLAIGKWNELEDRVLNEGKTYATKNKVSLLHQIADWVEENGIGQYEGMAKTGKGMPFTLRLNEICDCIGFNHVPYQKLSRAQKLTNSLIMFYEPKGKDIGWYEIPIQSDYESAYNFIKGDILKMNDIFDGIADEIEIEVERIAAIKQRLEDPNSPELGVIDTRGTQIQIFPEFNTNGFLDEYAKLSGDEARAYLIENVKDQMRKVIAKDIETINNSGMLSNEALSRFGTKDEELSCYDPEGKFENLSEWGQEHIVDWCLNTFFARIQICKIFTGGLYQFNGLIDYEKRNMMLHAPHSSLYTEATWKGEKVGKESENVVYCSDLTSKSAFINEVTKLIDRLKEKKVITSDQAKLMIDSYENIKSTDGQGFRTLESWREVKIMSADWNDRLETAYQNIMAGHPTKDDISLITIQMLKPVYSGFEILPASNGDLQKPIRVTVLHKYSEAVLLPLALAEHCLSAQSVPLMAFNKVANHFKGQLSSTLYDANTIQKIEEELKYVREKIGILGETGSMQTAKGSYANAVEKLKDFDKNYGDRPDADELRNYYENQKEWALGQIESLKKEIKDYQAREKILQKRLNKAKKATEVKGNIDLFLFGSDVKVGAHGMINIFDKDGNPVSDTSDGIADSMISQINADRFSVHTLPYKFFGIAASTKEHDKDDKIAIASQAEKVTWANISEGEQSTFRGKKVETSTLRDRYYDVKQAEILLAYNELKKLFTNPDELEKVFKEEIISRPYVSTEARYALSHLKDGSFALPLFSPNIQHEVQTLLSSIIRKRMTKHLDRGTNLMVVSSLGMEKDYEVDTYNDETGLSKYNKLEIKYGGKDENFHERYVEAYAPIVDSAFEAFADENGGITPERLDQLVEDRIIDERALYFFCYRTPSDAEHSTMICKIKGFLPPSAGQGLRLPKDIMVRTGMDFDGDKQRCHFPYCHFEWNEDKIKADYENKELSLSKALKYAMGKSDEPVTFGVFAKWAKSDKNPDREKYMKLVYEEYDTNKSIEDNTQRQRANYKLELIQAKITSPDGSARMAIPGGYDDTKVNAYSIYAVRKSNEPEVRSKIADALSDKKIMGNAAIDRDLALSVASNPYALYENMHRLNAYQAKRVVMSINDSTTPFSLTRSADSFDDIMKSAEMIGIYAMYSSAFQLFQRLDLRYIPRVTQSGKPYNVGLFGETFDKLFQVKTKSGVLGSLTYARLINAAVDNGKEPVLGFLNQAPELAPLTFLMAAAGIDEENIHLVLNQPVVVRLVEALKTRGNAGLVGEAQKLLDKFTKNAKELKEFTPFNAVKYMNSSEIRGTLIKNLAESPYDIEEDASLRESQSYVLQWLCHLNSTAENLAMFAKLTRPETESGSIGIDISEILSKQTMYDDYRSMITWKNGKPDESVLGFSGSAALFADTEDDFNLAHSDDYIKSKFHSRLQEVEALNYLMIEHSTDLFENFFPQAKKSWKELAKQIASQYQYKTVQSGSIKKVAQEMILWKILSDPEFVNGNLYDEQKRVLVDVPYKLRDVLKRISKAKQNASNPDSNVPIDDVALSLANNIFLNELTTTDPTEDKNPRIIFSMGGSSAEGRSDAIRMAWNDMLNSEDKEISDLAIDLFRYGIYTSGFTYGMYSFLHFAPFSVIVKTPFFLKAAHNVMNSDWSNENDTRNFINQWAMNHWGDSKLFNSYKISNLSLAEKQDGDKNLYISSKDKNIISGGYVIVTSGKDFKTQNLYRVERSTSPELKCILVPATKLGYRNRRGQVTLQYNPQQSYTDIEPVVPGNESVWGDLRPASPMQGDSNIDAPNYNDPSAYANPLESMFGKQMGMSGLQSLAAALGLQIPTAQAEAVTPAVKDASQKAIDSVTKNDEVPQVQNQANESTIPPIPAFDPNNPFGSFTPDMLANAEVGRGEEKLSLARIDETGKPIIENVEISPKNLREARRQKAYVTLNQKLRDILRAKNVPIDVLDRAEAMMGINGVTLFDTADVVANGIKVMIQLAEGKQGEYALPEEFAHVAIDMLGYDHPLVQRLLNVLHSSDEAMQEAYDGQYYQYVDRYGADSKEKLVVEAAGKILAKQMIRNEEIQHSGLRGIVRRVWDKIKELLHKFRRDEIQLAIDEANNIASKLGRELLSGAILDQMSFGNVRSSDTFYSAKKDLTNEKGILADLMRITTKRLTIIKKRLTADEIAHPTGSLLATQEQVKKLEAAMKDYKTEDAIVNFMSDSLDFLRNTEESLDQLIDSGSKANSVCAKLNVIRDTLFSYSTAIDAVNEAIIAGEISDSKTLTDAIGATNEAIAKFYMKYERIARTYFEEMLSNVYGKEGVTVSIGKDKGKVISIKEMAQRADHDISLASRLFHSLADCDDYVLVAIDDLTREAKMKARRRVTDYRPRIEKAVADLKKAQGDANQMFMFETKIGEDGKRHRTGKYISKTSAAYRNLTDAQKKFYDVMIDIKNDLDRFVPESLLSDDKMVMLRKYTVEKAMAKEGVKEKSLALWEGIRASVMDMSDDYDPEFEEVAVDFENNKVDRLPLKYLNKGKNESYDDMSDDVALAIMSYAGMVCEYDEVHNVINILENAKYMASERKMIQKRGLKTMRETIDTEPGKEDEGYMFHQPFAVKAARSRAQEALEDYFQMHLYGHIQKAEGTFGKSRISKRKVANMLANITSLSQMALNLPQRIANINTGFSQILIESIGKGKFDFKDVMWASGIYTKETKDRLAETGKTDYDNKLSLFADYFDLHQNNGRNYEKYDKKRISRIVNSSLLYAGLTAGEDYLALTTGLAMARNFKVKSPEGKIETLWDAYEVKHIKGKDGAYLSLKDGYTKEDGSPITAEDERNYSKSVAAMNFAMQGIYNLDDRSAIQQYALGSLFIMYRKWIAPALKRRYGKTKYSAMKGEYEEGYYTTLFHLMRDAVQDVQGQASEEDRRNALMTILTDFKAVRNSVAINWRNMTDYERSNLKRAKFELGLVLSLFISCALIGKIPPEEIEDDPRGPILTWWDKSIYSQLLRLRTELGAQAPTPMFADEAMKILRSPLAAIGPLSNVLNAFRMFIPSNWFTEIKSGRYKGHVRAYKYFRELPVISMFKKFDNFIDPSPMINYYKSDSTY